jgi:hypothetical protein
VATNVTVYVPNEGEKENLRAILKTKPLTLFLYKASVIGEGALLFASLSEWTIGGGRAYARKDLGIDVVEDVATADKWFLTTNTLGRAEGQYSNAALSWTFNSFDVADGASVFGVGAFTWVVPFDAGAIEIKVGDKIKGVSSLATGIVTGVCLISGTWGGGTAAGYLDIMTKTGTFQDGESITVFGAINATSLGTAPGTNYAVGDTFNIIEAGASGGKGIVLTVNTGAVVTFAITHPGTGYTVANNKATTKITGSGNDALTIDVDSLAATVYATTNTGVTADAHKRLMAIWPFTSPLAIVSNGQALTWEMKQALATGV